MAKKIETIEELKSKLNRTELLLEINGQVAGLNDLSQILWKVIKFLTQELDADRATLFLKQMNFTHESLKETLSEKLEF